MAFTQPNSVAATHTEQAYGFGQELEEIANASGLFPRKCVLYGALVTDNATGLQIDVSEAVLLREGNLYYEPLTQGIAASTADGSNPRIDYVVYDVSGAAFQINAGTAAASPVPPAVDADQILLAELYIPASATTLTTGNIIDKRLIGTTPPDIDTLYVDTDNGTDPGASGWVGWGRTWETAYATMSAAVTDAAVDDTIYVRGTYAAFTLTKRVIVIGTDEANSSAFARTTSSSGTLAWKDGVVQVTGANTISLPDADDYEGKNFFIQRHSTSFSVTIQPGTFSIVKDGTFYEGTAVLATDGAAIGLYSDGTDWFVAGDRGTVTYT